MEMRSDSYSGFGWEHLLEFERVKGSEMMMDMPTVSGWETSRRMWLAISREMRVISRESVRDWSLDGLGRNDLRSGCSR